MRWGPGRSWIAWWKRMQTLQGDCDCASDESGGEIVNTLRNGIGAPDPSLGIDGDFYIDTSAETIYGPRGGIGGSLPGQWVFAGSPISLIGPGYSDIPDPVNGILAKAGTRTVRTATQAKISTDGNVEFYTTTDPVAASGNMRSHTGPNGAAGFIFNVLSESGLTIRAFRVRYVGATNGDQIDIGGSSTTDSPKFISLTTTKGINFTSANLTPENFRVGFSLVDDPTNTPVVGSWGFRRMLQLQRHTNFALMGKNSFLSDEQVLGSGEGVSYWGDAEVVPTGNPTLGYIGYTDPTTHHPMARLPDGTLHDLIGDGDVGASEVVSAEENVDLGAWPDKVTTIELDNSNTETPTHIESFSAPAAGRTGFIWLLNVGDGSWVIEHDNASTPANGVICPGGTNYSFTGTLIFLVYSHTLARWVLAVP